MRTRSDRQRRAPLVVTCERARHDDAAPVVSWLGRRADVVTWAGETAPDPLSADWLTQQFNKSNPRHYTLKGHGGDVAGLFALICFPDENRLHLTRVIVAPDLRGAGIGKRIVAECLRLLFESQAGVLTLHVFASNQVALALYEQAGFQRTALQLSPVDAPDPLIRMEYRR